MGASLVNFDRNRRKAMMKFVSKREDVINTYHVKVVILQDNDNYFYQFSLGGIQGDEVLLEGIDSKKEAISKAADIIGFYRLKADLM